jgi:ABC-type proline/glycine betaine transport system permease subunit
MKDIYTWLIIGSVIGAFFMLFGIATKQFDHVIYGAIVIMAFMLTLALLHGLPKRLKRRIQDILNSETFFN